MRMEIDEFEPPDQSAANGVVRAAGGTVVPRDQQCGVLDKVVVTHGITPCMIGRGERHAMIGRQPAHAGSVRGRQPGSGSPVPGKELRRPAANRASACAESAVPEKRPKRNPQQEKRPMREGQQQKPQRRERRQRKPRQEKRPMRFGNRGTRGPLQRQRGRSPWPCRRGKSGSRGRTTPPPSRAEPQRLGRRKCGGR